MHVRGAVSARMIEPSIVASAHIPTFSQLPKIVNILMVELLRRTSLITSSCPWRRARSLLHPATAFVPGIALLFFSHVFSA